MKGNFGPIRVPFKFPNKTAAGLVVRLARAPSWGIQGNSEFSGLVGRFGLLLGSGLMVLRECWEDVACCGIVLGGCAVLWNGVGGVMLHHAVP